MSEKEKQKVNVSKLNEPCRKHEIELSFTRFLCVCLSVSHKSTISYVSVLTRTQSFVCVFRSTLFRQRKKTCDMKQSTLYARYHTDRHSTNYKKKKTTTAANAKYLNS